jgi:hypothetical protein
MDQYSILNNRKRAVVALVHSIAFGLLATYQMIAGQHPVALVTAQPPHLAGPIAVTVIYTLVSAVLLVLVRYARAVRERLYFALCATSATVGLTRVIFGDPTLHFGSMLRVLMLGCAVITGTFIVREHSARATRVGDLRAN